MCTDSDDPTASAIRAGAGEAPVGKAVARETTPEGPRPRSTPHFSSDPRPSDAFIQVPALPINEEDQRTVDALLAKRTGASRPLRTKEPMAGSPERFERAKAEWQKVTGEDVSHLQRTAEPWKGARRASSDTPAAVRRQRASPIRLATASVEPRRADRRRWLPLPLGPRC